MISGADVLFDVKLLAQFTQEVGGKSGVSIGDDLSRQAIVREYVSKVELSYSWFVDFFSARDKQCCFGAVMVGDGEYGVKAPRLRELGDEIKGDCFKGKGVLWFDWVRGRFSLVCVRLVCLALSAALHIIDNKLLHVRPPVVVFEEGKSV